MLLIILILSISFCISKAFANNEVETTEITYTVSQGETLWTIAKKYKLNDQDIRDYIYKVEKINNMDSAKIYEGQVLKILTYKEAE